MHCALDDSSGQEVLSRCWVAQLMRPLEDPYRALSSQEKEITTARRQVLSSQWACPPHDRFG